MELAQVYETFISNPAGMMSEAIRQEFGINILTTELDLRFMPPYLESVSPSWQAYICDSKDEHLDLQFYFIVDIDTQNLVEYEVIS